MMIQFPIRSMSVLMALFPLMVVAQHLNNEPGHAFYLVEPEREMAIQMDLDDPGKAAYKSEFSFHPGWSGKQVFLRFSGIEASFDLWINSFKFGTAQGRGLPVEFNITPMLNQDLNRLVVGFQSVDDLPADQSCISVLLIARDPVHVRDLEVTDYSQYGSNESLVRIHLWIKSYLTDRNKGRTLNVKINTSSGETIGHVTKEVDFPISFRQEIEVIFDEILQDPKVWTPSNPELYQLEIDLIEIGEQKGEMIRSKFGIGDVHMADSILVFNGDTLIPVIAEAAVSDQLCYWADKEILEIIEEKGYNVFLSEQPLPVRVLELFDRTGIVVLRDPEKCPRKEFRSEINRPSVVWME